MLQNVISCAREYVVVRRVYEGEEMRPACVWRDSSSAVQLGSVGPLTSHRFPGNRTGWSGPDLYPSTPAALGFFIHRHRVFFSVSVVADTMAVLLGSLVRPSVVNPLQSDRRPAGLCWQPTSRSSQRVFQPLLPALVRRLLVLGTPSGVDHEPCWCYSGWEFQPFAKILFRVASQWRGWWSQTSSVRAPWLPTPTSAYWIPVCVVRCH